MKFQIKSQEDIQKRPKVVCGFLEWASSCEIICRWISPSPCSMFHEFRQKVGLTGPTPHPRLLSKHTSYETVCNSMWEDGTRKLWKSKPRRLSVGIPLPYQQCIQKPFFKTCYFWWWQISPNSHSKLFLKFWGYIQSLVCTHTYTHAPQPTHTPQI